MTPKHSGLEHGAQAANWGRISGEMDAQAVEERNKGENDFARKSFAKVFFSKYAMKSGCQGPVIGGLGVRCR